MANHDNSDFMLLAKLDGKEMLRQNVGDGKNASWQTVTVDPPYAGKTVTVEPVNQPGGWLREAAYWGGIKEK